MRKTLLALTVMLTGAAIGCSPSSSEDSTTPACRPLATACSLPSQCCSGACDGTSCIDPATCDPVGAACGGGSECCTGSCENGTCVEPTGSCELLGQACTTDGNCCNGNCPVPTSGPRVCAQVTTPPTCGAEGAYCTADSQCCSTQCDDASGRCTTTSFCKPSGTACASDSECCTLNCPGAPTPGATCSSNECRPSGTTAASACSDGTQCCSGICSSGHCSAVPPSGGSNGSCTTLGEACNPLANTCCSTNCQDGTCLPASFCSAPGDICWRSQDCCSGLCTVASGSAVPGRCLEPTGSGCTQDGAPCTNDSNCCTRRCVDLLGTGAKVCQPAGGCRMTGNYCDSTQSCCGGTDDDDAAARSPYGVYCDQVGVRDYTPHWDPASKDNRVCSGGQSCNPPGNICGGTGSDKTNASQNCCTSSPQVKGSDVCKKDMNQIWRCFGGGSASCTTGWDGADPSCCIPEGDVCQFRDQCCNYAPCVPDGAGVLRCAATTSQCLPRGARCSAAGPGGPAPSPDPCCTGDSCQYFTEIGWACAGASCSSIGDGCTQSSDCCVGSCVGGVCATCGATGAACTTASQCCTGICNGGKCGTTCVPEEGVCTATSDCCPVVGTTVTCVYQPGATSGACKAATAPPAPSCAATGQACSGTMPCCSGSGNECLDGICAQPPPPSCSTASQACTGGGAGNCCGDLWCRNIDFDADPNDPQPPTACSGAYCACEGCSVVDEPCSTNLPCCLVSQSMCATNGRPWEPCTSTNSADCTCSNMNQ